MATKGRCSDCKSTVEDHCQSPTCPWVKCPTHDILKLTPEAYFELRGRKAA